MVGHNITPASKRFRSTQTSTAAKPQQNSTPARGSHFLWRSQPASSSPYTATPFSHARKGNDDIESSYDDDDVKGVLPNTGNAIHNTTRLDAIDDDEYDHESINLREVLTTGEKSQQYVQPTTSKGGIDDADTYRQFESPLPKRQKLLHTQRKASDNPILVSSSPTDAHSRANDNKPRYSGDEDIERQTEFDNLTEPTSVSSKFLTPTFAKFPPTETSDKPAIRSVFKAMAQNHTVSADHVLPDAFSPSKRRGKRSYIQGGLADTVRQWVLEIANQEIQNTNTSERASVSMKLIGHDQNGRFDLAEDDQGNEWMLVRQEQSPLTSKLLDIKDAEGRIKILFRSEATRWQIERESETPLQVAVLWDILR